jgi:hypothetical protein
VFVLVHFYFFFFLSALSLSLWQELIDNQWIFLTFAFFIQSKKRWIFAVDDALSILCLLSLGLMYICPLLAQCLAYIWVMGRDEHEQRKKEERRRKNLVCLHIWSWREEKKRTEKKRMTSDLFFFFWFLS